MVHPLAHERHTVADLGNSYTGAGQTPGDAVAMEEVAAKQVPARRPPTAVPEQRRELVAGLLEKKPRLVSEATVGDHHSGLVRWERTATGVDEAAGRPAKVVEVEQSNQDRWCPDDGAGRFAAEKQRMVASRKREVGAKNTPAMFGAASQGCSPRSCGANLQRTRARISR